MASLKSSLFFILKRKTTRGGKKGGKKEGNRIRSWVYLWAGEEHFGFRVVPFHATIHAIKLTSDRLHSKRAPSVLRVCMPWCTISPPHYYPLAPSPGSQKNPSTSLMPFGSHAGLDSSPRRCCQWAGFLQSMSIPQFGLQVIGKGPLLSPHCFCGTRKLWLVMLMHQSCRLGRGEVQALSVQCSEKAAGTYAQVFSAKHPSETLPAFYSLHPADAVSFSAIRQHFTSTVVAYFIPLQMNNLKTFPLPSFCWQTQRQYKTRKILFQPVNWKIVIIIKTTYLCFHVALVPGNSNQWKCHKDQLLIQHPPTHP